VTLALQALLFLLFSLLLFAQTLFLSFDLLLELSTRLRSFLFSVLAALLLL
jgi:hypothetical protein